MQAQTDCKDQKDNYACPVDLNIVVHGSYTLDILIYNVNVYNVLVSRYVQEKLSGLQRCVLCTESPDL